MSLNLKEIFTQTMKDLVDPIMDSSPTTYQWWSMYSDLATLADRKKTTYVRHFKYPTIAILTNPVVHDDTHVVPARVEGNMFTGSTRMLYVDDPDLEPSEGEEEIDATFPDGSVETLTKPAQVNWVLKRHDKLVCVESGDTLIVSDATPSSGRSHLMVEMIGIASLRTEYGGGTFDD